jgi:hypothetical protein
VNLEVLLSFNPFATFLQVLKRFPLTKPYVFALEAQSFDLEKNLLHYGFFEKPEIYARWVLLRR